MSNVSSSISKKETVSKVEPLPQSIKEIIVDSPISSEKEIEIVNIVPNVSETISDAIQETKQEISSDAQIVVVISDPISEENEVVKQSDTKIEASNVEATSDSESIDPSKKKKKG